MVVKSMIKAEATYGSPISNIALWGGTGPCGTGGWWGGGKDHLQPLPSEQFHPDMYQTTAKQPKKKKQQETSVEEKPNSPTMG